MNDLDFHQNLLITNWQKKYFALSQLVLDSLIGLSIIDTLEVLGKIRKEKSLTAIRLKQK